MNHLKNQKSPYLLQHADNLVNWLPWCKEAFEQAIKNDKPLFISIGYSTCYWCQVMNNECFNDVEVANLINDIFVPIKVDREERRDVDNFYMHCSYIMTKNSGWPLTVFATPEGKPFFVQTYIPKFSSAQNLGMIELLPKIGQLWKNKREEINRSSEQIYNIIKNSNNFSSKNGSFIEKELLDYTYELLYNNFDLRYGGFGKAPKFPFPNNLQFLLNYGKEKKLEKPVGISLKTLMNIRLGGIYDQVGGGIHRYSTDERWLIPHFEKTLYDQALIAECYIDAYNITKDNFYKNAFIDIFNYCFKNLLYKGAFFAGEDAKADFYLWSYNELIENFSEEIDEILSITEDGNFLDEVTGEKTGKNILSIKNLNAFNKFLKIREKFIALREKRISPEKDRKILSDWNSIMAVALFKGFSATKNIQYIKQANNIIDFILKNMCNQYTLFHCYISNEKSVEGFLDNYIFFINALLHSYKTQNKNEHLELASRFMNYTIENFWDFDNGGFFFTHKKTNYPLLRKKEFTDSVLPSANSVAFATLIDLYNFTNNFKYKNFAEDLIKIYYQIVNSSPISFLKFLSAYINFKF